MGRRSREEMRTYVDLAVRGASELSEARARGIEKAVEVALVVASKTPVSDVMWKIATIAVSMIALFFAVRH